jgi:hypothetical protein
VPALEILADAENVELVGHLGGLLGPLAVRAPYLLAGIGPEIAVLDLSKPDQPVRIAYLVLPDLVQDIAVAGRYAYVADYTAGLWIIDVANPAAPALAGVYDTPGYARGLAVTEPFVYLADDAGLRVIDVSTPGEPAEAAFYDTEGSAGDVLAAEDFVYILETRCFGDACAGSLKAIDVSDPAAPAETGAYDLPGYATDRHMARQGNFLYVADGYGGLHAVSIADPAHPAGAGVYREAAFDVALTGGYAYVAQGESLRVVDVADPAGPVEIARYDQPVRRLVAEDERIYTAGSRLDVIDVSGGAAPRRIGVYQVPGAADSLAVAGSYVYLVSRQDGLSVIEVSDPSAPARIGGYTTPREAQAVAARDGLVYLADGDCTGITCDGNLWLLDASNPDSPVVAGLFDVPGFSVGVTLAGDYAYLADRTDGLGLADVSNPAVPVRAGVYDTPGFAMEGNCSGLQTVVL